MTHIPFIIFVIIESVLISFFFFIFSLLILFAFISKFESIFSSFSSLYESGSRISLDHMFLFFVLQIKVPFREKRYSSYCSNSIDFSSILLTILWVSFVVEFLSFKVLLVLFVNYIIFRYFTSILLSFFIMDFLYFL